MRKVGIFRNQLFKPSETFILNQAKSLKTYRPVYIGRRSLSIVPDDCTVKLINENSTFYERFFEFYNAITTCPKPFLSKIKDSSLDLIHSHFAIDSVYGTKLAQSQDIPSITTLHGFDITTKKEDFLFSKSPSGLNYYFNFEYLKKSCNKFLCVSDFIYECALRKGIDESKLIKHYIGIDVHSIQPRNNKEEEQYILHIARLVEKKGTSVLISAFSKLKKNKDGYKLIIIGDGPLLTTLKKKTVDLGIEKRVIFLGFQTNDTVLKWIKKSAMVVMPSITANSGDSEGLPTVLLEASAAGVPLIGTTHAGIPELIKENINGYLVPERDEKKLLDRMEYLIDNASERYRLGEGARNFVVANFDLGKQTAALELIYENVSNDR